MIDFPWEHEAMRGDPMPDGLPLADQWAFQAVSHLYARYCLEKIEKDAASEEKQRIKREWQRRKDEEKSHEKFLAWENDMRLRIGQASAEFRKSETPEAAISAAKKILEAFQNVSVDLKFEI